MKRHIAPGVAGALLFLCGCAHAGSTAPDAQSAPAAPINILAGQNGAVTRVPDGVTLAIVHTAPLLKSHPLANALNADIRELYILANVQAGDQRVDTHADIVATQKRLERQLTQVARVAQAKLNAHAEELGIEERREIAGLLTAADRKASANQAAYAAVSRANADFAAIAADQRNQFLHGISAEQRSVIESVRAGLDTQSRIALETKAAQYSQEESTLAADLAKHDEQERVTLRLKQANLHLTPDQKANVTATLATLDRDQNAALMKKRADDAQALAQYADDLKNHRVAAAAAAAQTMSTVGQNAAATAQIAQSLTTPQPPPIEITPAAVDPRLRASIAAVHAKYQARFTHDEQVGVAAFAAQRANFQAQLRDLEQADAAARTSAQKRVDGLQRQRDQLQATMLADIQKAITIVAAREHIGTVVVDPLGAAPGARDLTADVAKQFTAGPQ